MIAPAWRCYVINLDRSPDRLVKMDARLRQLGVSYERVPGVDGLKLPDAEFRWQTRVNRFYKPLSRGEVGCHLSHLEAKRRFLASGAAYALILEDDALMPDELPVLVHAALARRAAEVDPLARWDVLKLTRSRHRYVNFGPIGNRHHLVEYGLSVPATTTAALWTRSGAEKWVRTYDGARRPIDCDLQHPWEYDLIIRSVHPPPVGAATESVMGGVVRRSRNPWPKIHYEAQRFWPKLRHYGNAYGWSLLWFWLLSPVRSRNAAPKEGSSARAEP